MTFVSISTALPLSVALSLAIAWAMRKSGSDNAQAATWAFSLSLLVGVAALLSDSPSGLVRAVWPREAVDWLAIAAIVLTVVAQWQQPAGRMTLVVGVLLGILIVCRLLLGSVYLRPAGTSASSLVAIALGGTLIGLCWYLQLDRHESRNSLHENKAGTRTAWPEAAVHAAVSFAAAATLGMSGSMQYGMIGGLATLASCAAWLPTRIWPGVGNLVTLMLLGLGLAFAELRLVTMLCFCAVILTGSLLGRMLPTQARWRSAGFVCMVGVVGLCVGLTARQFFKDVKGDNASYGGYEAYK